MRYLSLFLVPLFIGCAEKSNLYDGINENENIHYAADPVVLQGVYNAGYEMGWRTAAEEMKEEYTLLRYRILRLKMQAACPEDSLPRLDGEIHHLSRRISRLERALERERNGSVQR